MISPTKLYRLLREHPDLSNPAGRSRDRYRRVVLTSVTMFCATMLNAAVGFVTIPIVSKYLGDDLFGIWMLLTGFISFLVFADLGIGIGFQNQLIKCYAEDDREMPSVWVSNTLLMMVSLCLIMIALSIWAVPLLPLEKWIKFRDPSAIPWLIPSAQALGISFSFGLPGMMFQYIGSAYQRGYWPQLLWMIGRFLSLVGTVVAAWYRQPLPVLIAIYVAPPYVFQLLGLFWLWIRTNLFRPAWHHLRWDLIRSLFRLGGGFLVNRITDTVQFLGPNWIVAVAFSAAEAGYVATAMKILHLSTLLSHPLFASLHPAFGESVRRNDWKWVSRVMRQAVLLLLVCNLSIIGVVLLFGNPLLRILLDNPPFVPVSVFASLGLLLLCMSFSLIPMTVLNSMNHLRYQTIYRVIFSIVPFGVVTLLCRNGYGLDVVLFGFVLTGAIPFLIASYIDYVHYKRRKMASEGA